MEEIIVLGSINMDLVTVVDRKPKDGETISGKSFFMSHGGKGANQAVSIARLGKKVKFFGKVGNDQFGNELLDNLRKEGIDVEAIIKENNSSGLATITLDSKGENSIIVISGANGMVDKNYIDENKSFSYKGKMLLCQLEIPYETVLYAFSLAKSKEMITVLNPAPAKEKIDKLLLLTDILICNETEFDILTGEETGTIEEIVEKSPILFDKGIKDLIITLGAKGVLYINKETSKYYEAYKVEAIDTTAAGDSFIGGFLSALDKGIDFAIDRGMKAGAIAVTRLGAQSSIANLEEVEEFGK